jgi:hypothetical protein
MQNVLLPRLASLLLLLLLLLGCPASAATRTAASYGAKGDGRTNDAPALQRMLDAMEPGDIATWDEARIYRIGKALVHSTPDTQLWFNGATLLLDTSNSPDNNHLVVTSTPARYRNPKHAVKPVAEFDGKIDEGWLKLPQAGGAPMTTPAWLALGVDPHDKNEEHFGTIVLPGESRVRVPYAINGTHHKLFRIDRVCQRVLVKDLRVETAPGRVADANLRIDRARHVAVSGLRGHVTVGCLVADSEHVDLSDFDVDLTYTHQSGGRVIGGWQSRYVTCDRITFRGGQGKSTGAADGFYLESWCGHWTIDHVFATYREPPGGWGWDFPTFFVAGGSYDISIPYARIDHPRAPYPYDIGGEDGNTSPRFGTLELVGNGWQGKYEWMIPAGRLKVNRIVKIPTPTSTPTTRPAK